MLSKAPAVPVKKAARKSKSPETKSDSLPKTPANTVANKDAQNEETNK